MRIGIALVDQNGETYLVQIPKWSDIEAGDSVVVGEKDKHTVKVVNVIDSIETDDKYFMFIVESCGAKLPLPKVVGKIEFVECRYMEGEADGEYYKE